MKIIQFFISVLVCYYLVYYYTYRPSTELSNTETILITSNFSFFSCNLICHSNNILWSTLWNHFLNVHIAHMCRDQPVGFHFVYVTTLSISNTIYNIDMKFLLNPEICVRDIFMLVCTDLSYITFPFMLFDFYNILE